MQVCTCIQVVLVDATDARSRILEAAVELFGQRGYSATTTRSIAQRAGVNEVTLFRLFQSKRGLLQTLAEVISSATEPVELDPSADLRHTLKAHARREVGQTERFGACALRLAFDAPSVPEVAEAMNSRLGPVGGLAELTDYFTEVQRRGQLRRDLAPEVLAEAFTSLTGSFLMARRVMGIRPDHNPIATIEALVDVFCDGATAPGGKP